MVRWLFKKRPVHTSTCLTTPLTTWTHWTVTLQNYGSGAASKLTMANKQPQIDLLLIPCSGKCKWNAIDGRVKFHFISGAFLPRPNLNNLYAITCRPAEHVSVTASTINVKKTWRVLRCVSNGRHAAFLIISSERNWLQPHVCSQE